MNLHNNRVGRKLLMGNMKKQCKCHGVSGSCVTKTCWKVVPDLETFANQLKQKYERAQQVRKTHNSKIVVIKIMIIYNFRLLYLWTLMILCSALPSPPAELNVTLLPLPPSSPNNQTLNLKFSHTNLVQQVL